MQAILPLWTNNINWRSGKWEPICEWGIRTSNGRILWMYWYTDATVRPAVVMTLSRNVDVRLVHCGIRIK
jgi:hypothetical protein